MPTGFLSGVNFAPTTPTSGGFLSGIKIATPQQSAQTEKVDNLEGQGQILKSNADYANSLGGTVMNTIKGLPTAYENEFKNLSTEAPKAFQSGIQEANEGSQEADSAGGNLGQRETGLEKFGEGVIGASFSPIAPIFDPESKALSMTGNAIANSPSVQKFTTNTKVGRALSSPTAATIGQHVGRLSNIGLAVAGGIEGSGEATPKPGFLDKIKTSDGTPVSEAVKPNEVTQEANAKVPPKTLSQMHDEYMASQPKEETPVKPPSKPTVQTPEETKALNESSYSSTPDPTRTGISSLERSRSNPLAYGDTDNISQNGTKSNLTPVESTGEVKTSTLASKVSAKAMREGLDNISTELPEYNKANMEEQNKFATDLWNSDPERAVRIAMGQEAPPLHIIPEKVFEVVEKAATKAGDGELINRLTTESNLSTQATAMGQRIRALADRDELSATKSLREVQKARAGNANPAKINTEVSAIKSAMKAARSPKETWASFADSITCKA